EDENVIQIDNNLASENEIIEDIIHEFLESCRGVGKPEEHYNGFKETVIHTKHCLPLIPILYLHVIVTPMYIEFHEIFSPFELVDEIPIFHDKCIKFLIILHQLKFSIFLFDKGKGRGKW
ncbi:hypothetical protein PAXRUDRAFT_170171, partial [Paxillus rubicundulus Ve08.2h10]